MTLFVNHLVSCGVFLAIVWSVCRFPWLQRRPAIRHALWLIALLRLVTPPLAQIPIAYQGDYFARVLSRSQETTQPIYETTTSEDEYSLPTSEQLAKAPTSSLQKIQQTEASKRDGIESTTPGLPSRSVDSPIRQVSLSGVTGDQWLCFLGVISLFGTAMICVSAISKYWRIEQLIRKSHKSSARASALLHRVSERFNLKRPPVLLVVDASITPTLWVSSDRNATILLSQRLLEKLGDTELEQILAHEIAHWYRCDHWAQLIANCVVALVWWNPMAWLARRELMASAEICCDALAIDRLGDRKIYATTLLKVVDFLDTFEPHSIAIGTPFGESTSIRERFRSICGGSVRSQLSWTGRCVVACLTASLVVLPVQSQEKKTGPIENGANIDPSLAKDVVMVLGEDRGRVTGLALHLAIDPTRKLVYLTESNGEVSAFDTESLKKKYRMQLHDERALDIALADDGKKLISIATDGKARLWDISTQPPKKLDELSLAKESSWLNMATSQLGDRVVFRSPTEFVIADIVADRIVVKSRLGSGDFAKKEIPFQFAVSSDGRYLAMCESLGTSTIVGEEGKHSYRDVSLKIFDINASDLNVIAEAESKDVETLMFSPDGKRLLGVDPHFIQDRKLQVWLFEDEELILEAHDQPAPNAFIGGIYFSESGSLKGLINESKVEVFSTAKTAAKTSVSGATEANTRGTIDAGERVLSMAFSGEDVIIFAGNLLQRWDWKEGHYQERKKPVGHHANVETLKFDPDKLYSSSSDASYEWDLTGTSGEYSPRKLPIEKGEMIARWIGNDEFVTRSQENGEERWVGRVRAADGLWKIKYTILPFGDSANDSVWCIAKHPTEQVIATGHWGKKIRLWDVDSSEPHLLTEWVAHEGHVCELAFSPDGTLLASVGWDHHTKLWETPSEIFNEGMKPTGKIIGSHGDVVRSVEWSSDGAHLASGGEDGKILVWDLDGSELSEPRALFNPSELNPAKNVASPPTVGCIEFSKNGERLLSGDGMGRVKIWDLTTGKTMRSWQLPGWVWSVSFSPDETKVATGNNDGTIYILRTSQEANPSK